MNPRQAREYKHSQKRKAEEMRWAKAVAEQTAKEAKQEKAWQDLKKMVIQLAKDSGEEREITRVKKERGGACVCGGLLIQNIKETDYENGDTKIVVFTKYLPDAIKNREYQKSEYGTTTEMIINRKMVGIVVNDCK